MNDKISIADAIIDNYAQFSIDKDSNKYRRSYNLARVALENSFKYIALDINETENLKLLFNKLKNINVLKLKQILPNCHIQNPYNINANIDKFATWKDYLLLTEHGKIQNNKYLFISKNDAGLKYFLKNANESSHVGLINKDPKLDEFINSWIEMFTEVQSAKADWKRKIKEKEELLKFHANDTKGGESSAATTKKQEKNDGDKVKVKPHIDFNMFHLFVGLIIISVVLFLIFKPNSENPTIANIPETQNDSTPKIDTPKPKTHTDISATENEIKKPVVNETEVDKKEEKELKPVENAEKESTSKYILNDEFKNEAGSNEMAVLIINNNNNTNADISPKVASVFLKNKGYINTASLLSREFVTDGLFEKIFNGGKIDFSKYNFKIFADYFCLGKLSVETSQSDERQDMTKTNISLEIKVIKTTNGGVVDQFTVPYPYNIGAGFSKDEAIKVATNNIITYLKNYKYEN